jgi:hypothetical protein
MGRREPSLKRDVTRTREAAKRAVQAARKRGLAEAYLALLRSWRKLLQKESPESSAVLERFLRGDDDEPVGLTAAVRSSWLQSLKHACNQPLAGESPTLRETKERVLRFFDARPDDTPENKRKDLEAVAELRPLLEVLEG